MEPLTKKQQQILEYINSFIVGNGYSPSYREVASHFNLSSVATVAEHINSLRNKGFLDCKSKQARSITITANEGISIPFLGYIAAGLPIEAIETNETLDIPKDMSGKNVFALKVKGDSMIDDGILNGDYVIIEQSKIAQNGDIVVALLNKNEVTLKRFYKRNNYIYLQPANKRYKPIKTRNVEIQGTVKGVIRKFIR